MDKIYVAMDNNIPQYACTQCRDCKSLMGISLCAVKNRGCCSYFPKFELVDLQRMSTSLEGMRTLRLILENPGTTIYNYYIHAKGFFDEKSYKEYMKAGPMDTDGTIEDHTIFFRACPFVKQGQGCTLPPRYRTFICNFFICKEVLEIPEVKSGFQPYEVERARYIRWLQRENEALAHMLDEEGITLVTDFDRCIELLRSIPAYEYEFPVLEPILLSDSQGKGA